MTFSTQLCYITLKGDILRFTRHYLIFDCLILQSQQRQYNILYRFHKKCIYVHAIYIYIHNVCTPHMDIYHTNTHLHICTILRAKFYVKKGLVPLPELYYSHNTTLTEDKILSNVSVALRYTQYILLAYHW